jgi:hypothetical protein
MQHWPFSCFLSVLPDCSYELLFILYTNQIIRESTYIMSDGRCFWRQKKILACVLWRVLLWRRRWILFVCFHEDEICRRVRELASTAETNSISRNKLGQQSAFWWRQQRRFLTMRSSGRIFMWTLRHLT